MSMISEMKDENLVHQAIVLDAEKKRLDAELNTMKAEIQKRGLQTMMDYTVK